MEDNGKGRDLVFPGIKEELEDMACKRQSAALLLQEQYQEQCNIEHVQSITSKLFESYTGKTLQYMLSSSKYTWEELLTLDAILMRHYLKCAWKGISLSGWGVFLWGVLSFGVVLPGGLAICKGLGILVGVPHPFLLFSWFCLSIIAGFYASRFVRVFLGVILYDYYNSRNALYKKLGPQAYIEKVYGPELLTAKQPRSFWWEHCDNYDHSY